MTWMKSAIFWKKVFSVLPFSRPSHLEGQRNGGGSEMRSRRPYGGQWCLSGDEVSRSPQNKEGATP
jgi:hypothetical protein